MNDKKHIDKKRKKLIILGVVVIAIVGGICAWYVIDRSVKEAAAIEQREAEEKAFKELYLNGDVNRGADYVAQITKGDKDRALNVYMDAVTRAETKQDKIAILTELIEVAIQKNEYKHVVVATEKLVEIHPSIDSYYRLSVAYSAVGEYVKAIAAHEQILSLFDTQHNDVANTDNLIAMRERYVQELESLKMTQQIMMENQP